jgi:myosin heavy subunit
MKKESIALLLVFAMAFSCACNTKTESTESLAAEVAQLKEDKKSMQSDLDEMESLLDEAWEDLDVAWADLDKAESAQKAVSSEFDAYKESMAEYEQLAEEERQAREIEASKAIAKESEEKRQQEEKAAEEQRKQEEKEAKEAEEKAKKGYDTGITYDQLARNPDEYNGEKVKYKGKVIQVVEGDSEVTLRVAVNRDYDKVILVVYAKSLVSSRVLEDDTITVYGTSQGLYTYQSTMGGMITIPLIFADKIDQ